MNKVRQLTEKNEHLQLIWRDQNTTIDQPYGKWSKELNSIIHQSFHKRRIKHSHNTQILPQLFKELRKIQKLLKENQTDELQKREKEVLQQINERQYSYMLRHGIKNLKKLYAQGSFNKNEFYKVKRKISCRTENKTAVLDERNNLITMGNMIKKEYINEFRNRLNHRSIDTDLKNIESNINKLFELCMQLGKGKQTTQYSDDEILKAIKQLKCNQSQEPEMLKTELFLDSGSSFRLSIGLMFSKIKQQKSAHKLE